KNSGDLTDTIGLPQHCLLFVLAKSNRTCPAEFAGNRCPRKARSFLNKGWAFQMPRAGVLGSLTECPLDIRPAGT
ncbi:MAG: hypothetical protein KA479_09940, partial [Saprospiraceae bacterium]|nr:hypothetical protein [Saprospiraceae bacterium]